MPRSRRGGGEALNPWPGYVDALSTLLMVIIFVLLVFVLAQAFLSVTLSGQDRTLQRLGRQVAELNDLLSLEKNHAHDLQSTVTQLTDQLNAAAAARDQAGRELTTARSAAAQAESDRDRARTDRDQLATRLADANVQAGAAATRFQQLQAQLADLNKLNEQVRNLTALRDDLEKQAQNAAARAVTDEQRRAAVEGELATEKKFSDSARAQIAALTGQLEQLRDQVQQLTGALDASEKSAKGKDAQIADLGTRLNTALASKVEELQHYRSEFFGRLRDVLQGRQGIQVVGDRFVFQSEVLFPPGGADLSPSGQEQIKQIANTLKSITAEIPRDVHWILRVDGHADRQPLTNGQFASNWELSAERAINVVKLLIAEGIPPDRLAATGFGEFQPLDSSSSTQAYARNRRIELRLTDR